MRWIVVAVTLGGIWIWAWRRRPGARVSRAWLIDAERRRWGVGQDGVNWTWPVKHDE